VPILTKLRLSLILIAVIPLALFGLIAYITSSNNVAVLERDSLNTGLDGANRALLNVEQDQIRTTRDYAYWDELHTQVDAAKIDPDWQKANLDPNLPTSPISTFSLDALGIWTKQQQALFTFGPAQTIYDTIGKSVEATYTNEPFATFFPLDNALYLVTVASVRSGDATTPNGIMIFARKLGQQDVDSVTALTGNEVAFYTGTNLIAGTQKQVPAPAASDLLSVARDGVRRFDQNQDYYAVAYDGILNSSGEQVATLVMWRPRTVLQTSQQLIRGTLAVAFVVGGVLALIVAFVLGRSIVRPLTGMAHSADRIAAGDLQQRIDVARLPQDELRSVADSFNRMTDQLAQTIDQLNGKIIEIDAKNSALQVASAKAETLARTRGEFLSTISHELRTPLNAIIGFSDVLLMGVSGPLNTGQHGYAERLKDNGNRLLSLINDILDVSRIDAGRIELAREPFTPLRLFERVAADMQILADEKQLRFQTTFSPMLPTTMIGDEKRLEQIAVNLLANAFKFTEKGSVELSVDVLPDQKLWTIAVRDTGIGIAPHAFELIFEPFRQVDGSPTRVYKGTGLGLAIVKQLVQTMGGKIGVESELGAGSTFTVRLPLSLSPIEISPSLVTGA
jgi:signal transduction histidine kinase